MTGVSAVAAKQIAAGYETDEPSIDLGRVSVAGVVDNEAVVRIPPAMFNRHGLIAGATGTGKTINVKSTTDQSKLFPKYATRVDSESAKELLEARIAASAAAPGATPAPAPIPEGAPPATGTAPAPTPAPTKAPKAAKAAKPKDSAVTDFLKSSQGKQIQNHLIRGAFGILNSKIK